MKRCSMLRWILASSSSCKHPRPGTPHHNISHHIHLSSTQLTHSLTYTRHSQEYIWVGTWTVAIVHRAACLYLRRSVEEARGRRREEGRQGEEDEGREEVVIILNLNVYDLCA